MLNTATREYKKAQDNVMDSAHKVWLAGLGTVKTVGVEGTELFNRLVDRGRDLEETGKREIDSMRGELKKATNKVENRVDELGDRVDRQVGSALHRLGVPTRNEIKTLTKRVEELSMKVDGLVSAKAPVAVKAQPTTAQPTTVTRTTYHVTTHKDGWKVALEGTKAPVSAHDTKAEALDAAREIAKTVEPSQVVVHKQDGTIQTQFGYGE